jgi:hypothetical protein
LDLKPWGRGLKLRLPVALTASPERPTSGTPESIEQDDPAFSK